MAKNTKRKPVIMTGGSPAKVKIELEADQLIKLPNPHTNDDQSMTRLEVMLKEEGKEPKIEEP